MCWGEWAGTLSVPGGLRGGPQCARGGAVHGDPQYVRGVGRCMGTLSVPRGAVHGDPQYVRGSSAWGPSVCPGWGRCMGTLSVSMGGGAWGLTVYGGDGAWGPSVCPWGAVHGDPRCARGGGAWGSSVCPGGVHGDPQCAGRGVGRDPPCVEAPQAAAVAPGVRGVEIRRCRGLRR